MTLTVMPRFHSRSGKNRSDLQILTLDDTLAAQNHTNSVSAGQHANIDRLEETFRREGNAEILELSRSTLEDSIGGDESSDRVRSRQVSPRNKIAFISYGI